MAIYFIGGSPCSGKSTVALALSAIYGLHYFKVDDHLDRYLQQGAQDGKPACTRVAHLSPEQIWMRDPQVQCEEELLIYEEIFDYVLADLAEQDGSRGIITEGAAWLPMLMKRQGIPYDRYISLTPTKDFQVKHYSQRPWISFVLEPCRDKAAAFANWMERDALFAQAVQQQCRELGNCSLVQDGNQPEAEMIERVAAHFGLAE